MYVVQAVILAGGLGTRVRNITEDKIPKVMLPINGKPFLLYILDYLKTQNIKNVVLCVGFKKEIIKDYFRDGRKYGLNLFYSEEKTPLGTAGALKNAERFISSDRFLLLNGDTLFKINLDELLRFHNSKKAKISVALKYLQNTQRYGRVEINSDNAIIQFIEKGIRKQGIINGGLYLMERDVLSLIEKFPSSLEKDVLPMLINKGLYGKVFDEYFIDIGVPEDYERAKRELG
ncbi:MAG: nucleotidyltransferase family protein [Caldisericaceae bacterium]|nr:nucleotidyltransferase family protein [Caldisericaceae bacterium]